MSLLLARAAAAHRNGVNDPFYSNVVALLHLDGSDGSTSFPDQKGVTWSAFGAGQIDVSAYRFGGASLICNGAGSFIASSATPSLGFTTGDFTIEGYFKRNGFSTDQGIYVRGLLSGSFQQSNLAHAVWFSADDKLNFRIYIGSSVVNIQSLSTVTDSSFHHFAMCASGSTLYGFLDGVLQGSASYTGQNDSSTWLNAIGSFGTNWGLHFNGWIDEVRTTKGVARYTSNFTPPAAPFPNA